MFSYIYTSDISAVVVAVLFACGLVYAFYKLTNKLKSQKYIFILGIIVYILMILYKTVLSRQPSDDVVGLSLIPFETYKKAITVNIEYFREAFMNVVFFVPLGLLYGCTDIEKMKKNKWILFLFSVSLSVIIEAVQYIFKLGYAEIDDVIHNVLGSAIGLLLFMVFEWFTKLIFKKIKQNTL